MATIFLFKWKSIQEAIEACELLQLPELKDQLGKYVLEHVSVDNCIGWWKFSERYNLVELEKKTKQVMCTQLEKVSVSDEFKSLTLAEVIDYINDEHIVMPNRDSILIACFAWLDFEPVSRKDMALDILKHVNFEKCSSSALNSVNKKYKSLITDPSIMNLIYESLLQRLEEAENKRGKLIILGGMESFNTKVNRNCWVTSPGVNPEWEVFDEFPSVSQAAQSSVVCPPDGFSVMCGGKTFMKNTRYNAGSKSWSDLPPTPTCVMNCAALFCDNLIYLLGGIDSSGDFAKHCVSPGPGYAKMA